MVGDRCAHKDREAGPKGRPLYGIPVAIKDNIDVEGLPTTAACPAFAYAPRKDATVSERQYGPGESRFARLGDKLVAPKNRLESHAIDDDEDGRDTSDCEQREGAEARDLR